MPVRNPLGDKKDFFGDENVTHEDINFHLKVDGLREKEGRVVARPISIFKIWADPSQPRRVIPPQIRKSWNGDPDKVQDLVLEWVRGLKHSIRMELDWIGVLKGNAQIDIDRDHMTPFLAGFVGVLDLAMNIRDKGLNSPITVVKGGDGDYLLHTGERRWMAHHLLQIALGKDYEKIAAIEREYDVWTQVAENTQRSEMNAISMCRSLAKLVMAMYAGEVDFQPYEKMVQRDGNDQRYYAQVLDLNIKHGMAEQVLNALNTTSRGRITQYRNLLKLPPVAWMIADERDYTEGYLREILRLEPVDQIGAAQENWSLDQIAIALGRGKEEKVFTTVNTFECDEGGLPPTPSPSPSDGGRELQPAQGGIVHDREQFEEPAPPHQQQQLAPPTERYEETWVEDDVPGWDEEELPRTPLASEAGFVWIIDYLMPIAKEISPLAAKTLKDLRDRNYEDLRIWAEQNPDGSYQDKLSEEGTIIDDELLRAISGRVWKLLDSMLRIHHEIGN